MKVLAWMTNTPAQSLPFFFGPDLVLVEKNRMPAEIGNFYLPLSQ